MVVYNCLHRAEGLGGKVRVGEYGGLVVIVGTWYDGDDAGRVAEMVAVGEGNRTAMLPEQATSSGVRKKRWR